MMVREGQGVSGVTCQGGREEEHVCWVGGAEVHYDHHQHWLLICFYINVGDFLVHYSASRLLVTSTVYVARDF